MGFNMADVSGSSRTCLIRKLVIPNLINTPTQNDPSFAAKSEYRVSTWLKSGIHFRPLLTFLQFRETAGVQMQKSPFNFRVRRLLCAISAEIALGIVGSGGT
jgi:hypothetical protein